MAACLCGASEEEKKGPRNVESDLNTMTYIPISRWLHGTLPPLLHFCTPMYYSYHLLTLPKYKSVKLFLCVDSQGAWSLVSCLKPIRKCGYDWGCPWGLFLDGFLYYTNILDWLSQPNS